MVLREKLLRVPKGLLGAIGVEKECTDGLIAGGAEGSEARIDECTDVIGVDFCGIPKLNGSIRSRPEYFERCVVNVVKRASVRRYPNRCAQYGASKILPKEVVQRDARVQETLRL